MLIKITMKCLIKMESLLIMELLIKRGKRFSLSGDGMAGLRKCLGGSEKVLHFKLLAVSGKAHAKFYGIHQICP
jgi:hypothetical protein